MMLVVADNQDRHLTMTRKQKDHFSCKLDFMRLTCRETEVRTTIKHVEVHIRSNG